MTDQTKQGAIASEIRRALKDSGPLSSADMVPLCGSAMDSTDICRVLCDMRKTGLVEVADERAVNGKGKPVKFYRWIGQDDTDPKFSNRQKSAPAIDVTPESESRRNLAHADRADPTELILADLLDQADEALLALADSLLGDHPVWSRLRQLASDAHGALCDYRLMRSLEK